MEGRDCEWDVKRMLVHIIVGSIGLALHNHHLPLVEGLKLSISLRIGVKTLIWHPEVKQS